MEGVRPAFDGAVKVTDCPGCTVTSNDEPSSEVTV
jgi:hypothetical protein